MKVAGAVLLLLISLATLLFMLADDSLPPPARPDEARTPASVETAIPEAPPVAPAPAPTPPQGPAFSGRIVDEVGRAVPGASIAVRWKDRVVSKAVAGSGGGFSFPSVPLHDAEIVVRHPGFVSADLTTWTLDPTDAVIRIRRGMALAGVVLREADRSPVAGALATVRGTSVRTGADGRFRHPAVPIEEGFALEVEAGADGRTVLGTLHAAPGVPVSVLLPETRVLEGRVVRRGEDGAVAGVSGVRVASKVWLSDHGFGFHLVDDDGPETVSGPDGSFRLEGLTRAGRIQVKSDAWYRPVAMNWSFDAARVEVEVFPYVTVSGTVLTHDKRPAAGAVVRCATGGGTAVADAAGRFRLGGVPMSVNGVRLSARSGPCSGYDHVQGRPGQDRTGIRIRLGSPADVRSLRGRVVGPDGTPVPFARIIIRGPDLMLVTRRDGTFERRWSGKPRHCLEIEGPGFEKMEHFSPDDEPDLGDIVLTPLVPWPGRLVDEDGAPVARAEVGLVNYQPQNGRPVNPDGTFVLGVPAGKLPLFVYAEGYRLREIRETPEGRDLVLARVPFVTCVVFDLAGDPVAGATVASGGWLSVETDTAGRFRLETTEEEAVRVTLLKEGLLFPTPTLVPAGARGYVIRAIVPRCLAGRVVDEEGAPVKDARLYAFWGDPGPDTRREARTDERGRFRFDFLPVEKLTLWTLVPLPDHCVRHRVGVAADTEDLELVAERGGEVAGVVVDTEGRPVAKAWVRARSDHPEIPERGADAQTDGTFRLRGLLPAKWTVRAGFYGNPDREGEGGMVEVGATGLKIVIRPKTD